MVDHHVGDQLVARQRIVGQLRIDRRVDHHRAGRYRPAAWSPSGAARATIVGRDRAARPRLVLDDHGLAEPFGELLRDDARHDVVGAAGREADDHADRLPGPSSRGVGLRGRRAGTQQRESQAQRRSHPDQATASSRPLKKPRRHSGARRRREPGIQQSRKSRCLWISGPGPSGPSRNDRGRVFRQLAKAFPKKKYPNIASSRQNKKCYPFSTTYRSFSTIAATFSPIMMVGRLVLAQGTLGMIEASATRRPSTP